MHVNVGGRWRDNEWSPPISFLVLSYYEPKKNHTVYSYLYKMSFDNPLHMLPWHWPRTCMHTIFWMSCYAPLT